jgi:hypothetical protein
MSNKDKLSKEPSGLHPGFAGEINRAVVESEVSGGIYLENLKVGHFLEVETRHRIYTIERRIDGFYISGHPRYCPEPTKVDIKGSTFSGSMLKKDFIGRGMHLECILPDGKTISTSRIEEIKEFPAAKIEQK